MKMRRGSSTQSKVPSFGNFGAAISAQGDVARAHRADAAAHKSSSRMYAQLTNSFMQVADVFTVKAINSEIRDSASSGETKGVEGAFQDSSGAFEGYEENMEIFTWDRASNDSAKASFQANVASRASTTMKNLSKEVDGDKNEYEVVAREHLNNALGSVTDEKQREFITESYAKSYNQNMQTVSSRYVSKSKTASKDGWDEGRAVFEEDFGVMLSANIRDKQRLEDAKLEGDTDTMMKLMDTIDANEIRLTQFKQSRLSSSHGGIQLGALTNVGVNADTHADIVKALSTTFAQEYSTADTVEQKFALREDIKNMPEAMSEKNELYYLTPKAKEEILTRLDNQELHEQKMWKSNKTRDTAEFALAKGDAIIEIQGQLLDGTDVVNDTIDAAFKAGYITLAQEKSFKSRAIGGSEVERDDWGTFTDITNNIEDYSVEEISTMDNLTDSSKRKFIGDRMAFEEEGEEFMTMPDYREGKNIIKEAYGFQEGSVMPEFLTKDKRNGYVEMQRVIQEFRTEKRVSAGKGVRNDGVSIAERLIKVQKDDITSKLRPAYAEAKAVKYSDIKREVKLTGDDVKTIIEKQMTLKPDTKLASDVQTDIDKVPPKTITEDGFFFDSEVPNPEYEAWKKRTGFKEKRMSDEEFLKNFAPPVKAY